MNNPETCHLKIKGGKYVKVQRVRGEMKLCIDDSQTGETVIIRQRYSSEGGDVEMAFHFRHFQMQCSPKVEENSLKLEWSDSNSDLPDSYWFKRVNVGSGDIYCLKSVVSPGQFVCLEPKPNRNRPTLGLSVFESQSVRVTHSRVN